MEIATKKVNIVVENTSVLFVLCENTFENTSVLFVLCEKGLQEVVGGLLRAFPFLNQCLSSFFSPLFLYSLKRISLNFSVSGD